ncbi:MAG: hypothetical protein M3O74_08055 [Pseudomonadota bacterium]|uniref:hypothetical protein n=1 Tax=Burkholderia sp. PAMC 28687 TaxID=1795874 RepID=UPI001560148F|nr:hypothetical protein [Burkholderia sp. PAMC 28687]MDP9154189.1 hypothetical protein [Pseudomonadota bacterium]
MTATSAQKKASWLENDRRVEEAGMYRRGEEVQHWSKKPAGPPPARKKATPSAQTRRPIECQ